MYKCETCELPFGRQDNLCRHYATSNHKKKVRTVADMKRDSESTDSSENEFENNRSRDINRSRYNNETLTESQDDEEEEEEDEEEKEAEHLSYDAFRILRRSLQAVLTDTLIMTVADARSLVDRLESFEVGEYEGQPIDASDDESESSSDGNESIDEDQDSEAEQDEHDFDLTKDQVRLLLKICYLGESDQMNATKDLLHHILDMFIEPEDEETA